MNGDGVAITTVAPWGGSFSYEYDTVANAWDRQSRHAAGDALAAAAEGTDTLSFNLFYDGTNFRRWLGSQMNGDGVAITTVAPWGGSFSYEFDTVADAWDRQSRHAAGDALAAAPEGTDTLSFNLFYDGANYRRWLGEVMSTETTVNTGYAPHTMSYNKFYDPDNTVWRWAHVLDSIPTSLTMSYNPQVVVSGSYFYDGSVFKAGRLGASDEIQMTDVATRAGEDSGNDWRKVKKEEIAVYGPAATTATAVDSTAGGELGDLVLASTYVGNVPNWCVYIKNAGGGSADVLANAYVLVSPSGSAGEWESLTWTECDSLATGVAGQGVCSFCYEGSAHYYVKVEAICGVGDDTTVDAFLRGNKG